MSKQQTNSSQQTADLISISRSGNTGMSVGGATVDFNQTSVTIGSRLTRSGATVVIGSGVSYVRVSYTVMTENSSTASYVYTQIRRNTTEFSQSIDGSTSALKSTSETKVIPVSAGDTISVYASIGGGAATLRGSESSTLMVEVIQ